MAYAGQRSDSAGCWPGCRVKHRPVRPIEHAVDRYGAVSFQLRGSHVVANRVANRSAKGFADAFLVVAPGITIRDRLRVLLPSDPGNY